MLSTPALSKDQIEQFKRDGFVVLKNAINGEEVDNLKRWTTELQNMPEVSGKQWVYHETSRLEPEVELVNRIEYISPFHEGFAELAEVLKQPMSQLFGEPAVLFKEKINFKMPGGDGFKPHQDSQAGWQDYAEYFISVLVGIDEATIDNGCLQMVRGHHRTGLYREWEPLTEEDMADMDFVHYPTEPGDLVFFDCYTPHASEPNLSESMRRLYFATYNPLSQGDHLHKYYEDKHKSFPPDIDRVPGKEYVFRV